jgi:lipooligosaccharide transport system permease protein
MNTYTLPPPNRIQGILAVLRRNLLIWKKFFFSNLVGVLAEPLLYLIALGYGLGSLIVEVEGMSYIQFIAPGLIVASAMYGATFEGTYGTYTRLVPQHTFDGILATPIAVAEILGGEILYASLKATVAGSGVLIVVTLFGMVHSPYAILVPVLVFICGVLFGGLAILVASMSPSYDFFNYYFTIVVAPMFLFSGIFFPLDQLPSWAQSIAWFSPLTHATNSSRALLFGQINVNLGLETLWLLVTACLPWHPTLWMLRRRLVQ